MRIIDLTQVADDAILDSHVLAIDDPSQTLKMTVAQLKEVIKSYLDDVFVNIDGDMMTGKLVIKSDDNAIGLKNITQDDFLYLEGRNLDDVQRWIVGNLTAGSDDLSLYNSATNASVNLRGDGKIRLTTPAGLPTEVTEYLHALAMTGFGSYSAQYDNKAPYFHNFSDASDNYHPLWKMFDSNRGNVWSGGIEVLTGDFVIHSISHTGTQKTFRFERDSGSFIPQSYANFDARYQKLNTTWLASNGWHRDNSSGLITQWGQISGGGAGVQVTFPIAFTTTPYGAHVQYQRSGAVDYAPSVPGLTTTGMTIDCDNAAGNMYWSAIGY